jgi:hypothetical protein
VKGPLIVALALAALLVCVPARADVAAGNLLVNGDAETGTGSADGGVVAVSGWTVAGEFTEVAYGASGGFPAAGAGQPAGGGANFFAGGNVASSTATQVVSVASAAAQIDAGAVTATLSALLGGWETQNDAATVTATFRDGAGAALGAPVAIGPVTAADRGGVTEFLARSASAAVPPGTRSIAVVIDGERTDGAYNDAYVDDVGLTLAGAAPTPVPGKSVVAAPVSGRVLVKAPGSAGFVALGTTRGIPLGSIVDARHGVVEITARTGQVAKFYDGLFKLTEIGAITQLALVEPLAPCGKGARAAAKKPKSRKLWGDGSGSFRTRGQFSSATVRGTKWLVQDSCAGTLTQVARGVVSVQDFGRHRTVLVKAGHRYLARR